MSPSLRVLSLLVVGLLVLGSCVTPPRAPLANLIHTARATGVRGPLAPQVTPQGILFRIAAPGASVVNLAGQFNGWSPEATELVRGDDGLWSVTLALNPAVKHRYKYLIDGLWIPDPANPNAEPDGYGGFNSIFEPK